MIPCLKNLAVVVFIGLALTACGGNKRSTSSGGYYGGDGPPLRAVDLDKIPDAVPKREPRSRYGNSPYKICIENHCKRYTPMKSAKGFQQKGIASWYGRKFHGRRTSSGETYDMFRMTAAHPTLPLPTWVRVTNLDTNKRVVVKVNDRGPFLHGRIIDLSYAAAHKLGIARKGTGRVGIKAITP